MKAKTTEKIISAILATGISVATFTLPVLAATTGQVAATVTVKNIAVTVSDGSVAYGTLGLSDSDDTTLNGTTHDSQTATNTGNVSSDFNIQGADTASWTLGGTPGSETYSHSWCTSDCDGTPTWNTLTTSYQTLATGIAESGTQLFDLQIETPTATADYTEQTANVTIQVVEGA